MNKVLRILAILTIVGLLGVAGVMVEDMSSSEASDDENHEGFFSSNSIQLVSACYPECPPLPPPYGGWIIFYF